MKYTRFLYALLVSLALGGPAISQGKPFEYLDVFDLQYASDPQIHPEGEWIVYRRMGFDVLEDRSGGNLWMLRTDGSSHQKLTSREVAEYSPRWSPGGDRLAFVSSTGEGAEIYIYWQDTGRYARLTQLPASPSSLSWSPDGSQLAFTMNVPEQAPVIAKMPKKPKDARWAGAPRITDRLYHEADGRGYIAPGFSHIFVMSA
ncbi:MAG: S9 family peptidase, partial [Bacteroidetes bacterium]